MPEAPVTIENSAKRKETGFGMVNVRSHGNGDGTRTRKVDYDSGYIFDNWTAEQVQNHQTTESRRGLNVYNVDVQITELPDTTVIHLKPLTPEGIQVFTPSLSRAITFREERDLILEKGEQIVLYDGGTAEYGLLICRSIGNNQYPIGDQPDHIYHHS